MSRHSAELERTPRLHAWQLHPPGQPWGAASQEGRLPGGARRFRDRRLRRDGGSPSSIPSGATVIDQAIFERAVEVLTVFRAAADSILLEAALYPLLGDAANAARYSDARTLAGEFGEKNPYIPTLYEHLAVRAEAERRKDVAVRLWNRPSPMNPLSRCTASALRRHLCGNGESPMPNGRIMRRSKSTLALSLRISVG